MKEELGLRERKKQATRSLLMHTALDMFEERGFEDVSVAEIAEAANVSKATVFNYFPTKEDLVFGGSREHIDEPAQVVRDRPAGQTPHGAMREYFLRMLKEREPLSGLSDHHPVILKAHRIIRANPALALRSMDVRRRSSLLLAEELIAEGSSELTAHLVASQLMHVQHILSQANFKRVHAGESPDEIYPDAVAAAEHAFRLLEHGIGDFMRRNQDGSIDVVFHRDRSGPEEQTEHALRAATEHALREAEEELYEKLTEPDQCGPVSHRASDVHGAEGH